MERGGVRYVMRTGVERDRWHLTIDLPGRRSPREKTVFGTRPTRHCPGNHRQAHYRIGRERRARCPIFCRDIPPLPAPWLNQGLL
jgi:hypothetical protein